MNSGLFTRVWLAGFQECEAEISVGWGVRSAESLQ